MTTNNPIEINKEATQVTKANYQILNGNELIIQGALEAGYSLYTGYPGSPLADYFNILHKKKKDLESKGIQVVIANSEANAAAMASGSKQAGRDCLVAMKSMGLHVASDALSVGNFANPGPVDVDEATGETRYPGVVIAVGDDPWSMSTSTPADSRYLFKHLHIPFLEPSTPKELKDWMAHALEISKKTSVYQGLLLTTFLAEGGGRVAVGEPKIVDGTKTTLDPASFDLSKNVMVPPNSLMADQRMILERFPKVEKVLKEMGLDEEMGSSSDIGIISSGVIFETLKQVLEAGDYLDRYSLYKVACSYPLVTDLLLPWLKTKKSLIVVEEKRGFLEAELRNFCQLHGLQIKILGKEFNVGEKSAEGFPSHGGLSYELVEQKLILALEMLGESACPGEEQSQNLGALFGANLPKRLPTFCPGCPHRETLSLLKDLRQTLKEEDVDLISHGDVGCYSLSFLAPFKEMHNLSAMGQGGALGAGLDMFTNNPSVVLMGDSTFFHSGITDISNSVQAEHNITYIILDNDNTAMTGHQMTPASGVNVQGHIRPRQSILNAVYAMGVHYAEEVNPSDRYFYKSLMRDVIKKEGVKVIVSNKECALTYGGRKKREERKIFSQNKTLSEKTFFQINTDACEDCRVCVDATGCPGLGQINDAYGTKVSIDPQICVSDGYCTKMKACPSFEKVIVKDYHPSMFRNSKLSQFDQLESELTLPQPKVDLAAIAAGETWRMVVTGVGGSGVTTISRVVAEAAKEMDGRDDLEFKFMDQKGLAQRNGNVTGHLCIHPKGTSSGAVTPVGKASLLVSPDLLDGPKQSHFLKEGGVGIFDKKFQIPLSILLDKGEEAPALSEAQLRQQVRETLGEQAKLYHFKNISESLFGKSVYSNAMLLGAAFQGGYLPFSLASMKGAFERAIPKAEIENNWLAFQLGRKVYLEGDLDLLDQLKTKVKKTKEELLVESLRESLLPWQNKKVMIKLFNQSLEKLVSYFPEIPRVHLAQYVHDIYIYDRGAKITHFISEAAQLREYLKNSPTELPMAIRTLARTYFIKDEVFISHMMISPMKRSRDESFYKELGRGHRIERINRPAFDIFGKTIEFDISPKDWMLKTMRHFRLLRSFLKGWHKREKEIALEIRSKLLGEITKLDPSEVYGALKKLENIKGYREVRYAGAQKHL
ncbi:MAG: hypothetical protein CME63_08555 [Halobacteriovoraceae bacterium]|nr:hypothetical protein [Halobacteriovoraceae bacterium]|tara:strand:+ start:30115 stop:33612 length:3498 start_codon:yes stop_codon:yes gene_type:complete